MEVPGRSHHHEPDGPSLEARRGHWIRASGQIKMVRARTPRPRLGLIAGVCSHSPNVQHHDVHSGSHEPVPSCGHSRC
eukprot:2545340-Pyramimonas_sp.AAC.1